ncbi:MAG: hypothetical protein IJV83_04335 [Clostridia bacterium]|nr:hypothetical protein [Clostridia bacterium]
MSIKPQFECHRYVGEICRLHGQSVVECRLPGSEIGGVLAVYAKAIPADAVCADGEVQYGGKVLFTVVYEDGDKKVCRAERGAEFFHKVEGAAVTPACFTKALLSAGNATWRREGSGLYVGVVVEAELAVYGSKQMEYVADGEDFIVKKEPINLCKVVCVTGETEGEDEFDSDYVGDVLLHSQTAVVHSVRAEGGQVDIDGEMALNICVLKSNDGIASYERLIPFHMQIPAEEAFGKVLAEASVFVKTAHLTATTDEEKGRSRLVFSYCISAYCRLHICEEILAVTDGYSTTAELTLKKANDGGMSLLKTKKQIERVSGTALLSPIIEGDFSLQAAVLPRAEISVRKTENGGEAEGAVLAEVLLVGADGGHKSATLSLPFVFPVDTDGGTVEADCIVCGLNVRRKKSGETEAEATLKLCLRYYGEQTWEYVQEVNEGEEYPKEDCAFSVFIPHAGEDLWQTAKRLCRTPEELQKSNPNLEFPLKEGERIFVYRQIT